MRDILRQNKGDSMSDIAPISVCVFCGSRPGRNPAFHADAFTLGQSLAEAGYRLVYGAGDVGLMGAVANGAQAAGGQTFGVIPTHLLKREVGKRDLSSLVITENMHERKKVMFMNAGAIVTLPGGPGSLDELFEVLTWAQLGLHSKPILLMNTHNYWDQLIDLIDHMVSEGFADPGFRELLTITETPAQTIAALRERLS